MTLDGFTKVACGKFNEKNFPGDNIVDNVSNRASSIISNNSNEIKYLLDNLDIFNLVDGLSVEKIINDELTFDENKKIISFYISENISSGIYFKITNNNKHNISDKLPKIISLMMKNLKEDDILELYLFELNNGEIDLYVGNHSGEIGKLNNKYLSDVSKYPKIKSLSLDIDDILNYKMLKNEN